MKRRAICVLLLATILILTSCATQILPALGTNSPTPSAVESDSPQPVLYLSLWEDAKDVVSCPLIGKVSGATLEAIDPATDVFIDGKALSMVEREGLVYADGKPSHKSECSFVENGAVFSLVDLETGKMAGNATVQGVSYFYEAVSGEDLVYVECTLSAALPKGTYLAAAPDTNLKPRPVKAEGSEGGDGTYFIIDVDIDGDGTEETLSWTVSMAGDPPETIDHEIVILRGVERLSTLNFFYDNDYTYPTNPAFLDINGDGVFELLLCGNGHNSYADVYVWENDSFAKTELGFYSGD